MSPRRHGLRLGQGLGLGLGLALAACGGVEPGAAEVGGGESSSADAASESGHASTGTEPDGPGREPAGEPTPTPSDPLRPALGPAFEDVTQALGLHAPHETLLGHFSAGVAWGDVDGDGWLDLFVAGGAGPSTLLRNEGDGTFSVSPLSPAVAEIEDSTGATFVDLDDDGFPELYVLCRGPNVLLHNEGGRALVDVSDESGLADPGPGATASWADWDADGDLDLFVANTSLQPDALYRNEGDGTFSDVRELLVDAGALQTFAGTFSDVDDDGDLDLYVVVDKHAGNQLWRNDGPGCGGWCFTEVGAMLGADVRMDGMGVAVGDVDGDGDLDFVVSDHGGQVLLLNRLGEPARGFGRLVHEEAGLGFPTTQPAWGIELVDYDGDGWLDVYAAVASQAEHQVGNPLYRNLGGGRFEDVSAHSGADVPDLSLGLAAADYDHDGRVDLAVGNRGEGLRLLNNRRLRGADEHFSTLVLHGAGVGGREAVGARVWLETTGGRVMVRELRIGSSLGAGDSTRMRFALGSEGIARLTVRWPDGTIDEAPVPPLDRVVEVAHPSLRPGD